MSSGNVVGTFIDFVRPTARARPTAGGHCEARVEVTRKSWGPPPREQWTPPVTGSREEQTYPRALGRGERE
jgi:hypothetical protein